MPCDRADYILHAFADQVLGRDFLDQQAVHRLRHHSRLPEQRWALRGLIAHFLAQQRGEAQPAIGRIDGRGNAITAAKRIEQRAEGLVQRKIADGDHARQQQALVAAVLAHPANERLAHRADRAPAGQQQGQPRQPQPVLGIARQQPRHQRIGEPAMGRDRIDLWP